MKPIENFENVKAAVEREPLPKGGYIVEIRNAEVKEYGKEPDTFKKLEISIEICEGDFKDFYAIDYRAQQSEDKKWRGILRHYIPKQDGSEKDEWTKSSFKALIEAIEDNNNNYHWDWNESGLKGLKVGCLFRLEEWEYNGNTGWKAQPFKFTSIEKIKEGKFKIPNDKPLKNKVASVNTELEEISDLDLPF